METVKGFKDYTGEEARKRDQIMQIIKNAFELYGFEPAETPILEYEEFAKGENVAVDPLNKTREHRYDMT